MTLNVSPGGRFPCKFNKEDRRGVHNDDWRICCAMRTGPEYIGGEGTQGSDSKGSHSMCFCLLKTLAYR